MTDRDSLHRELLQLPPPDSRAARQFGERRACLMLELDRALLMRSDIEVLAGSHNRTQMRRHYRRQALQLAELLPRFDQGAWLDTLIWELPAYEAQGFRRAYWPILIAAWRGALGRCLEPSVASAIRPLFDWFETWLEAIARCGWALLADPSAKAPSVQFGDSTAGSLGMQAIIHATPLALCITNDQGLFEYVNPAYCMFYGYAPVELLGQPFTKVVPPANRELLMELHERFIADGVEMSGEWAVIDREGEERQILADAVRIHGRDGRARKVTFIMDITERRRAELAREDVERLMRHDLRTPLNVIVNIPSLLCEDANLTDEQREMLGELERAGRTMEEMIDFSLRLHQLERGDYRPEARPLDLLHLLTNVLDDTQRAFSFKRIARRLTHDGLDAPEAPPCPLLGEPLLYYNLFANLVRNAFEASPSGEQVAVRLESHPNHVRVEIQNAGCIPEAIRAHFFEKYVTSGKSQGTGLGTYSARLIAETVGGDIGFRTSEEAGTVLCVRLPLDSLHPTPLAPLA
ncbi:MAG: HAMP domain-containing histidine kinase [Chromatiaceae bacterium]|nr:HAMP domain-containing histidine kinase [Chromatiaceae bacterium]